MAKRRYARLALALLIILSGCTTAPPPDGHEPGQEDPKTSTLTDHETESKPSQPSVCEGYTNCSSEKVNALDSAVQSSFDRLPKNDSRRNQVTKQVANEICAAPTTNLSTNASAGELQAELMKTSHAVALMNEEFNSDINPRRFKNAAGTAGEVAKYTTILGSYNHLHTAACAYDQEEPDTVEEFYIASAAFGVEVLLIQHQMYYKASFKVGQKVEHTKSFQTIQKVGGDEAAALVLSEVHWFVRQGMTDTSQYVLRKSNEMNVTVDLNSSTKSDLRQQLGERYDGLSTDAQKIRNASNSAVQQCAEEAGMKFDSSSDNGLLGKAKDAAKNPSDTVKRAKKAFDGDVSISKIKDSPNKLPDTVRSDIEECIK